MIFRELNHGKCKTYLVGCEATHRAALVDPVRERSDRYLAVLAYRGLTLDYAIDTHTHADHRTAVFDLKDLAETRVVMHRQAPAPHVDLHVEDGQVLEVGKLRLTVLHTPGHTPDGICLLLEDRVFTGDTLLIRGTGRADFEGGDAGLQYDSITGKLFTLPDATLVFPAHDYRGNTSSTIGEEKRLNPRLANRSREEYVSIMANLGLPLPDKIQEVLQPNQTALEDDRIAFPSIAQLSEVRQLEPERVWAMIRSGPAHHLLDVREPAEYAGELGHVPGSVLIPLKDLAARAGELENAKGRSIVAICRAGVRSTTAAAILSSLGFDSVYNLKGGMLAWNERKLPVER
ncbi:MAG: MBL fold metallo-hydrolase [Betaproteobacteria bacterium]|nr:MBL fold metallo-hydrolase [Betaproteobacteria bacterium]